MALASLRKASSHRSWAYLQLNEVYDGFPQAGHARSEPSSRRDVPMNSIIPANPTCPGMQARELYSSTHSYAMCVIMGSRYLSGYQQPDIEDRA